VRRKVIFRNFGWAEEESMSKLRLEYKGSITGTLIREKKGPCQDLWLGRIQYGFMLVTLIRVEGFMTGNL